jgi:hypothetical protein
LSYKGSQKMSVVNRAPTYPKQWITQIVPENTTALGRYAATDPDSSDALKYSLSGPNATLFEIDAATGDLFFKAAPDFESVGAPSLAQGLTEKQALTIYQLFIGLFGAAPGVSYFNEVADALEAGAAQEGPDREILRIAKFLGSKPEFAARYPSSLSDLQFATNFVQNLIGDTASAKDKLDFVTIVLEVVNFYGRAEAAYLYVWDMIRNEGFYPNFAGSIKQIKNQIAYAKFYTEVLRGDVTDIATLQQVISRVTPSSSTDQVAMAEALDSWDVVGSGPRYSITVTATDLAGLSTQQFLTVIVTDAFEGPFAPVAQDANLVTAEDIQLRASAAVTDQDSPTLTYSLVSPTTRGTVQINSSTGDFVYTPAKDANGIDSFTYSASDGKLNSNTATVTITVTPVNDAPVVALPLPDQGALIGSDYLYRFPINAFTDVESATLTFTANQANGVTLPAWLSFNPLTRTFAGKPASKDAGTFDVRVTASDGSLSVSDDFTFTVSDRPVPISFQPADGSKAVSVGSNLLVTFNGPVERGTGPVTLKTADGKVVETFTSSNATVSGSTLTLNPTADLSIFTKYVVELGAGAVKDAAGNGNAADSRYDFQTATQDGLYHFFVVAFAAAPGATYMGQLAEAVNFGLPLNQIVDIFTSKKQFTDVYPTTMSNRELATQLVNNIVKNSANTATKTAAIDDIDAALGIGWSRGKMLYTVFGNLASKPLTDPTWGSTAKQFQNQLAVARYFTEDMGVATETLATLRGVIADVTPDTDVSTVDKIVQIIGTIPPGG